MTTAACKRKHLMRACLQFQSASHDHLGSVETDSYGGEVVASSLHPNPQAAATERGKGEKREVRDWAWCGLLKSKSPAPSDIPPPAGPHLLILPQTVPATRG